MRHSSVDGLRSVRRAVSHLAGCQLAYWVDTGAVSHPERGVGSSILWACDSMNCVDWLHTLSSNQYELLRQMVRVSCGHFLTHKEFDYEND